MSAALQLVYAAEPLPTAFTASVYLAGPRGLLPGPSWRQAAVSLLADAGYDGVVLLPEPRERDGRGSAAEGREGRSASVVIDQIPDAERLLAWREEALRHADVVLFWTPPDPDPRDELLAREEWGATRRSGKVILGRASDRDLQRLAAARLRVPFAATLAEAIQLALPFVRPGGARRGGERAVPLLLWRSPAFQRWYRALRAAGNRLDDVEVEWCYRPRAAPGRPPLVFAMRPRVYVRGERRHKAGEVVVGRSDVSATVLYVPAPRLLDIEVVLVREFRSAVANPTGYVWELPGGSAENAAEREHDPRATAAREVQQETGLAISPTQLEPVPLTARQLAATILCHRAHLYRAVLADEQLKGLRAAEKAGRSFGANPGERCYVTIKTVAEVMQSGCVDWGQVGMILSALSTELQQRRG